MKKKTIAKRTADVFDPTMPAVLEEFIAKYFVAPFFLLGFLTFATSEFADADDETFLSTAFFFASFAISFFASTISCAISYIRTLERLARYPLRNEHFDD